MVSHRVLSSDRYVEFKAAFLPLANSAAFAAYAGLYLVPRPQVHPSYASLFDPAWILALRERLRLFLDAIKPVSQPHFRLALHRAHRRPINTPKSPSRTPLNLMRTRRQPAFRSLHIASLCSALDEVGRFLSATDALTLLLSR